MVGLGPEYLLPPGESMSTRIVVKIEKKDNTAAMLKAVKDLTSQDVLVGVPEEKAARNSSEQKSKPINNAALAYIHDKGSPAANIPPRPFFDPGINESKPQIVAAMKKVGTAAMNRQNVNVERGLHAVGLIAATAIKNKINNGPFQPLAESTLAARRARGRTGIKPLLDTGQLRNAITYVLRKK